MATIETRLARLESVQQSQERAYTDAEIAVRLVYILETGGPDADKVRALLEKVPEDDHVKP